LLTLNRGHWAIENRLQYVGDVTFEEDRSQVRTGEGPRLMASLSPSRHQPVALDRHPQHRRQAR
jgi:predicted transposase YbfD/YdcC